MYYRHTQTYMFCISYVQFTFILECLFNDAVSIQCFCICSWAVNRLSDLATFPGPAVRNCAEAQHELHFPSCHLSLPATKHSGNSGPSSGISWQGGAQWRSLPGLVGLKLPSSLEGRAGSHEGEIPWMLSSCKSLLISVDMYLSLNFLKKVWGFSEILLTECFSREVSSLLSEFTEVLTLG